MKVIFIFPYSVVNEQLFLLVRFCPQDSSRAYHYSSFFIDNVRVGAVLYSKVALVPLKYRHNNRTLLYFALSGQKIFLFPMMILRITADILIFQSIAYKKIVVNI